VGRGGDGEGKQVRRLSPSRIALTALAISTLALAIKVRFDSTPEPQLAFAQSSAPCGTDPSCGTVVQPPFPGDVNCDGVINSLDVPVMISLVFSCNLCPTCNPLNADSNCDGLISVADISALAIPCTLPTPGPNDCCQCDGTLCSVPASGICPEGCDVAFNAACIEAQGCVPNTPTRTPTPTLGPNDCCQCAGGICSVPSNAACPEGCAAEYDSACTAAGECVPNTPTQTLTPTLGPNDCCQCAGNVCSVPSNAACPEGCTPEYDSACSASDCITNTPTATLTPTLGPNDCCQCGTENCAVPLDSACPQDCQPQRDSACTDAGRCVTNTPTPTLTPTLGPNDCCQCGAENCAVPVDSACPQDCVPQRDSACTGAGECVANTPTPTRVPTLGPNDCCQCAGVECSVPSNSACPEGCNPVFDSACVAETGCVANTVTPTRTPTLGPNDCCQCETDSCQIPSGGTCPQGCLPARDSACSLMAGICVANTPTPTVSPTLGPNDCCECAGNTCSVPAGGTCPQGCEAQYDSACVAAGECVRNTPTSTPTRTRPPIGTRTPTMTPMIIPFPC